MQKGGRLCTVLMAVLTAAVQAQHLSLVTLPCSLYEPPGMPQSHVDDSLYNLKLSMPMLGPACSRLQQAGMFQAGCWAACVLAGWLLVVKAGLPVAAAGLCSSAVDSSRLGPSTHGDLIKGGCHEAPQLLSVVGLVGRDGRQALRLRRALPGGPRWPRPAAAPLACPGVHPVAWPRTLMFSTWMLWC